MSADTPDCPPNSNACEEGRLLASALEPIIARAIEVDEGPSSLRQWIRLQAEVLKIENNEMNAATLAARLAAKISSLTITRIMVCESDTILADDPGKQEC